MNLILLRLVLILGIFVAVSCTPTPVDNAQQAAEPQETQDANRTKEEEVRAFVEQSFIHGVPFEEARQLGGDAVPILISLLRNPPQEEQLTNIVETLGYIGDVRGVTPLIDFLENSSGEVSEARFDALLSVNIALGHIARANHDQPYLYLLSQTSSRATSQSTWSFGRYSGGERDKLLTNMAVQGLAVVGSEEACTELEAMHRSRREPWLSDNVREALAACRSIQQHGFESWLRQVDAEEQEQSDNEQEQSDDQGSAAAAAAAAVTHNITVTRHTDITFADATASNRLRDATTLLRTQDRPADVACDVTMRFQSPVGSFGTAGDGLDVVDSVTEKNTVLGITPQRFKVVSSIKACSKVGRSVLGCARGSSIIIVRRAAADVWAHEFGHNKGRGHRDSSRKNIMHSTACCTDQLNTAECTAFRQQP